VHSGFANSRAAKAVLEAVARALAVPKEELPVVPRTRNAAPGTAPTIELLKVLLKMKCEAHGVAPKLIASSEDIEAIAADDNAEVPALSGWRRDVFGDDALGLKHGEIGLAMRNGALALMTLKPRRREPEPQKRAPVAAAAKTH
jgi:ribonuclease D